MNDLKFIKSFIFDSAQYYLDDDQGNSIMLKINYKENKYLIIEKEGVMNVEFRHEVNELAKSLLNRKSGINRVKAIKI